VPLAVGARLGPYEVLAPLGAGGMGEVYRARDTRLDRLVALKLLPSRVACDPERRARFEREARTISSLNHPHICSLYDVGEEAGSHFLVMELVEGESLAERLQRGPLPREQVVRYGTEMAEALDCAHRQGVVHRDIKPANVMLTRSGAKLLDFGLARSNAEASLVAGADEEATEAKPLTAVGTVLGTYQYMSPEQLAGAEAGPRSDIFALGAVLYEMATGRRAFEGKSKTSLVAAILSAEPAPISSLVAKMPPALDHVVRTCLEKEPDDRWQSAHDVASELRWIGEAGSQAGVPATVTLRRRTRERLAWAVVAALATTAAVVFAALWMGRQHTAPRGPIEIAVPVSVGEASGYGILLAPALSPDETAVAYTDRAEDSPARTLWVRRLADARPRAIAETEDASHPFWSPDGREIAYFARGKLWAVSTAGGRPRALADASYGIGGAWAPSGVIVFASRFGEGLKRVGASGGAVETVTALDRSRAETGHAWPVLLPDGQRFLFISHTAARETNRIEMASLSGGERRVVLEADGLAGYVPPWLLFVRGGVLLAQRFDPDSGAVSGSARVVLQGLRFHEVWSGAGTSAAGDTVAYVAHLPLIVAAFWYGADGRSHGRAFEEDDVRSVRVAPDGRRILLERFDPARGSDDLWVLDAARGTSTRLTSTPEDEDIGPFTRDGQEVVYSSDQGGMYALERRAADGLSDPVSLLGEPGIDWSACDLSRDGRTVLAVRQMTHGAQDIWLIPLDDPTGRRPWLATEFAENEARFSPDGAWIALDSNRSGRWEAYVRRVSSGPLVQVSTEGGDRVRFRPDGGALYFVGPDRRLYEAPLLRQGGGLTPGRPRLLATIETAGFLNYDVAPDGRLLVVRRLSGGIDSFRVLLGWRARVEQEEGSPSAPRQR
jgi:eukaryotic-like serine/threonine-protein kinase